MNQIGFGKLWDRLDIVEAVSKFLKYNNRASNWLKQQMGIHSRGMLWRLNDKQIERLLRKVSPTFFDDINSQIKYELTKRAEELIDNDSGWNYDEETDHYSYFDKPTNLDEYDYDDNYFD